jgi:membrane complex biogenesis BtpA family protein
MKQSGKFPPKFLAAMIAALPLPGSPKYAGDDPLILDQALSDLEQYKDAGVDCVILENDHDIPYTKPPLDSKSIDLMTEISKKVRKEFKGPIGIQMLEGANVTSMEIAAKADLDFIRAEAYVFAHIGGAGLIEGDAGKVLRVRKELRVEHIKVFADVKKKHCSHYLTSDLDIADEIKQAEFFLADGIIVTSKFTGEKPDISDLEKARKSTDLPLIIGSGMTPDNITEYMPLADGFIVGSTFRKGGKFLEKLDPKRLAAFIEEFNKAKTNLNS